MFNLKVAPRGLTHFEGASPQVASGFLLMLAFTFYLLWQDILVFRTWAELYTGVAAWFGVESTVTLSRGDQLYAVVTAPATMPSMLFSEYTAMGTAYLLFAGSYLLHTNNVPGRYGLRALALILGLPALGYFGLKIDPELDLEAHLSQVFKMGYWFMALTPVLFGVTGFVLPGNVAKKAVLAALAVLYFFFSVPLLALFHLQVLTTLGTAWAPFLNVVFTVFLMSLHLVAFYGLVASAED